jgi:hypothetical protein
MKNIECVLHLKCLIANKTYTNGFRAKTGVVHNNNDAIAAPRAQKYNKFLGQQIRIEINQQQVNEDQMSASKGFSFLTLIFYRFWRKLH